MMMTPGEIYSISIELPDIAHTFPQGHRVRAIITSSNYPRFNRNMNTGGPMYPDGNGDTLINPLIAHNTIHLSPDRSSKLVFPVTDSVFTSVEVKENIQTLIVYPNPTIGKTRIQIPESFKRRIDLTITDVAGRIVFKENGMESFGEEIEVDLSKLVNGTYFLSIQQNEKIAWGKILKR